MAYYNHLSGDLPLHHFIDQTQQQQQHNQSFMSDQPDPNSKSMEPHNPYQTTPNWLNNALLCTQYATTTSGADTSNGGGGGTNFLNLHTAFDSTAASQASNQWLSRSILQCNHNDVVAGPGDSMIAGPELTRFTCKLL